MKNTTSCLCATDGQRSQRGERLFSFRPMQDHDSRGPEITKTTCEMPLGPEEDKGTPASQAHFLTPMRPSTSCCTLRTQGKRNHPTHHLRKLKSIGSKDNSGTGPFKCGSPHFVQLTAQPVRTETSAVTAELGDREHMPHRGDRTWFKLQLQSPEVPLHLPSSRLGQQVRNTCGPTSWS